MSGDHGCHAETSGNRQSYCASWFHAVSPIIALAHFGGFILRDAAKRPLLRMMSKILMVRRTATPRVSNHEAVGHAATRALQSKTPSAPAPFQGKHARHFRVSSGAVPGEPLPAASALRVSSTTRRDNG